MADKSISFIMPAYNEDKSIEAAVKTVVSKLDQYGFDYEIFIFNDGSTDNTGAIADQLAAANSRIKVFHNLTNMNLGYNFLKGVELASKPFTGVLPCHNLIAAESFNFILPALSRADVVIAYIANPRVRPFKRRVGSQFVMRLLNLFFGLNLKYYHLNFYRTDLLKKASKYATSSAYALMGEILILCLSSGASYVEVPFFRVERNIGKSKAMRFKNITGFLKTYSRLFWRIRILKEKIDF